MHPCLTNPTVPVYWENVWSGMRIARDRVLSVVHHNLFWTGVNST